MASYRIGYDMTILWSINDRMGAAVPLEDKVVNLYYICDRGRFKADIQIQDGNVIVWDFPGIKQRYLGSYGLTVEILQSGGKRIIRKDIQEAFELVSASYMEKNDNGGANISDKAIITLSSELDIYRISPIVPEIGENNNWWVDGVDTGRPATIDKEELNKKQEVYVTDFDVASLLSAKQNNTFIQADTQSLMEAVQKGKTIVVPEDNSHSGFCACTCYAEDGIYLSIFSISGRVNVWMDFVPEINPDEISILHTSDIPTKSEIPTKLSQLEKDIDFGEAYYITSFSKNLLDEEIPDDGKIYFFPCQEQGLTEAIKNKKSIRLLSSGSFPEMGYLESVRAETDDMNYLIFLDGVHVINVDCYLDGRQAEISRRLLITKDNINENLESDIYYITSFDYQGILRGILNGDNRIQCYEPNLYQAVKDNKAIRLFVDMRYHDGYYEASSAVVDDFIYLTFEDETSKFILDIVNDGSDLTFSIYDDTEVREELSRLETDKADKSELTELSEGIALRNVGAEDTDESVEEPDLPTPTVSNEWKCVFDGRMGVGENKISASTFADGTPLLAEEVVVQVLMDSFEGVNENRQGYVRVRSSKNKNVGIYGALYFEKKGGSTTPLLSMMRLKASPFIMVGEMIEAAPIAVAQGINVMAIPGKTAEIHEDIVYVEVGPTSAIVAAPPLIKIYAR
jgi:hypothetical protein